MRWHLITGEYPPQHGGVSDYTALVAAGLAAAGDEVHVWAPEGPTPPAEDGVTVHRLPGCFGLRALSQIDAALERSPGRLLVQYVPHMYGMRGMNLPLCLWLRHRCTLRPWVMFHEVAFPVERGQRLRHTLLALVQRRMAALVLRAAARVFVSTPAWVADLRRLAPRLRPTWLPVPSAVGVRADPAAAEAIRGRLAPGAPLIGHFGTYGDGPTAQAVAAAVPPLLAGGGTALLIGRGSVEFAARLPAGLAGRVHATGDVTAESAAAHLAACDLLIQPYIDGVSTRRTSLMAGLALGLPIVTTEGPLTEPLWRASGAVALTPSGDPGALVARAGALLRDPASRHLLGRAAAALYRDRFAVGRTIERLRGADPSVLLLENPQ